MKLMTARNKVRAIATEWREQYPLKRCHPRQDEIYDRLAALDPESASADDVQAIIGSDWIRTRCSECGLYVDDVVQLGADPPDIETDTVYICFPCLVKATALIPVAMPPPPPPPPQDMTVLNDLLAKIMQQPEPPSWLARKLHWLRHSWQLIGYKGANSYWRCRVCAIRRAKFGALFALQTFGHDLRGILGFVGPVDRHWLETGEWKETQGCPPKGGSAGRPRPSPLLEGTVIKGGQNLPNVSEERPPAPGGSGVKGGASKPAFIVASEEMHTFFKSLEEQQAAQTHQRDQEPNAS